VGLKFLMDIVIRKLRSRENKTFIIAHTAKGRPETARW